MTYMRCPTWREDVELRLFRVAGPTAGDTDVVVQLYRRHGHELDARPGGPTGSAVRIPTRYAARLAELILELATETEANG